VPDKDNIISTDRRTHGKRFDYTKAGPGDDNGFNNGFEAGGEVSKEKKGSPAGPRTISPQRELGGDIEEEEEEDDDEELGEYDDDDDDDGTDEYEEGEE
jgi:hypothetical protein